MRLKRVTGSSPAVLHSRCNVTFDWLLFFQITFIHQYQCQVIYVIARFRIYQFYIDSDSNKKSSYYLLSVPDDDKIFPVEKICVRFVYECSIICTSCKKSSLKIRYYGVILHPREGYEMNRKNPVYEFDKPIYRSNTNDTVSAIITPYIQHTPLLACLNFSACAVSALNASDAIVMSFSALFRRRTCVFDSSFNPFDWSIERWT